MNLSGTEIAFVVVLCLVIVGMIAMQNATEKAGTSSRGWSVTWTLLIIGACFAIYLLFL